MPLQTVKPEVPPRLPQARLFLDDLQQIANLFAEIGTTVSGGAAVPAVEFQAENQETTEIDDLPKVGTQTNNLSVSYYSRGVFLLFNVEPFGILWRSNGLPSPLAWQTHHQLEEILKRRPPRLLDALTIKGPHRTAIWSGFALGLALAALSIKGIAPNPIKPPLRTIILLTLALGLSSLLFAMRQFGPSLVVFDYSYKHAERRRERNSKLLFTLLG